MAHRSAFTDPRADLTPGRDGGVNPYGVARRPLRLTPRSTARSSRGLRRTPTCLAVIPEPNVSRTPRPRTRSPAPRTVPGSNRPVTGVAPKDEGSFEDASRERTPGRTRRGS